jgi:hypothetical protein
MYTVMVIDDSPFIVDIFVTMLERGVTVRSRHTAERKRWRSLKRSSPISSFSIS